MSIVRITLRHRIAPLLGAALLSLLSACASLPSQPVASSPGTDWDLVTQALRAQHWEAARLPLSRLMQQDLRNGNLQFLYALAEENLARDQDRSRLELAAVGYRNAVRFAPGHYWALLRLGYLELERGDYGEAQGHFAEAALDQPGRWEAFYGLGVASYYRRDLPLLALAARRGLQLAPEQPDALRLAAFAMAAEGNDSAVGLVQRLAMQGGEAGGARHVRQRIGEYLTVASQSEGAAAGESAAGLGDPPGEAEATASDEIPTQVVVEVTILLSSVLDQASRGVNLFDGLRVLYGYANTLSSVNEGFGKQSTRTITSQISTPQLNYSLNLFNDAGQYYSVVARPSITAHLGRESQFFAGRTVNVAVSGINLGQLQPIDVGVRLAVIPERIDQRRVSFRLDAARSFLSQEQIGTFDNSLTTFRQSVSATADVEFGQTLVLSALSEQVSDKSFSKVPVAGELPVLDWFTSQSTDSRRRESLLILVTPTLPLSFSTPDDPRRRSREADLLMKLWQERIDPGSELPAILQRLKRSPWLRTPEAGDLRVRPAAAAYSQSQAIAESLELARN
ncbi:MAG: hypothetical protein Q8Q73_12485 [Stagnimonas sp.]|nr:hypothetical protein [Stagnimonas sp.]